MWRSIVALPLFALASTSTAASPSITEDFLLTEGGALQGVPSVAYDSNHDSFLVAWTDFRNRGGSELDIYARIVDAQGQPKTEDFPVTTAPQGQGFSAVAFDPSNDRYLVAWTDWRHAQAVDSDIYARLVNADGTLHGPAFPIARRRVSQKYPAVAFDPQRGRFLVVWADDRGHKVDKVYGRYVAADGSLPGPEFLLTSQGEDQERPSVVFDPGRGRFWVVWRGTEDGIRGIDGIFVASDGGAEGPKIRIAIETEGCLPPSLYATSYAPADDLYLVAWTSGRNYDAQGLDVYGAFLSGADGRLRGPAFSIAAEADYQESASVTYDPKHRRFLVVWYDLRRTPTALDMDIYGRFVSPQGDMSEEFLVSDREAPGIRRFPAVAFSPRQESFLVVWEDGRKDSTSGRYIYGKLAQSPAPK